MYSTRLEGDGRLGQLSDTIPAINVEVLDTTCQREPPSCSVQTQRRIVHCSASAATEWGKAETADTWN